MSEQDRFIQAERQFQQYTSELRAGRMSPSAYTAAVSALRVTDDQGRFWMQQEGSGLWHVWLGDRWIPASPPSLPPPVPAAASPAASRSGPSGPAYSQPQPMPTETTSSAGCFGQALKYVLITVVLFGLIGAALVIFVDDFPPEGLLGVAAAAVLSLIISARTLGQHWEGEIIDLHYERVDVSSGDDDGPDYQDVLFANVREPSGKIRKERAMHGWKVGDRLRKRQGQMHIEHFSS